jgi:integrase
MARKRTLIEQREKGIFPHHSRSCNAKGWDALHVCTCEPTFQPQVWSTKDKRPIKGPKFRTIAEAKSWLVDARHDKKKGKLRPPSSLIFNDEGDRLLADMKSGKALSRNKKPYKPSVIRSYEAALDARLRPQFGVYKLTEISRMDVQDFADELRAEGHAGQTVDNLLMPMRVIYRRAIMRGDLEPMQNPTVFLELPASDGKRDRVAGPKEAAESIEALSDAADQALWAILFYAGLRWGEAQALMVDNVDLDAGTITVEHSWDKIEGLVDPKSAAGKRVIPICEHAARYLRPYVEGLGRDTGFLLTEETVTEPCNYGKRTRAAYAAWKEARLERLTPHNARHSFRSYLDAIPAISDTRADRYMGHSDDSMRGRYSHSLDGQFALDAAALDEYLGGVTAGKIVRLAAAS